MEIKNVLCFDIGGTFIKYGVVTEGGRILYKDKTATPRAKCRINIPIKLSEITNVLKDKFNLEFVGICTAGQVDIDKGEVIAGGVNFEDYSGAKLSEDIYKSTGLKAFVENDVNAAALGELWMGGGKEIDSFVCITLGTGIGGAIVIDRKLYRGFGGYAGEVGHMTINLKGEECNCGFIGCFERYASTSALVKKYIEASGVSNSQKEELKTNGEEVMKKVKEGDAAACTVYREYLAALVAGLVNLTHILDPGCILIGGGISAQGDLFFEEVNRLFQEKVMKPYGSYTRIIKADLDNDAGLLGAAYIVKERFKNCSIIN
ncbi:ROK family protein [Clostridium sp. YIM B02515]|uniref:ROK family protein n=1 Tax=Clostridium rhizosphaerae TaxID=2803861 RepID=A0ABS1TEH6_9CLOT|nr:ROK family protein [Clostridium rhizosphaerae]MBL4937147.1 ROK family protein [Clostridium rhizosphaerae]